MTARFVSFRAVLMLIEAENRSREEEEAASQTEAQPIDTSNDQRTYGRSADTRRLTAA